MSKALPITIALTGVLYFYIQGALCLAFTKPIPCYNGNKATGIILLFVGSMILIWVLSKARRDRELFSNSSGVKLLFRALGIAVLMVVLFASVFIFIAYPDQVIIIN